MTSPRKNITQSSEERVVRSCCTMFGCGIDVHVKKGKITKVEPTEEHPIHVMCVKARALPDWVYSKERMTSPLRKVNGEWQEISWDEAFTFISDKLIDTKNRYGAKALVAYIGVPIIGIWPLVVGRFCDAYGTPNYIAGRWLCFGSSIIGHSLVFNHDGVPPVPSLHGTKCLVVWGSYPAASRPPAAAGISALKQTGVKIIVVDPKATPLGKTADIHAQIRPGTDCALALGLLNVIIKEGLYDKEFVDKWTLGFERLVEHVKAYPPEEVERITWVSADTIRDFARMYANTKPASQLFGIPIDHCTNGVQTHRALSILTGITGNFDVPGGNSYGQPLSMADLRIKGRAVAEEEVGAEYPLFRKFCGETTATTVTETILTEKPYPIKSLILAQCNPMLSWPNSNKVKKAFEKLDLLVVIDLLMTETAKLADIFLPAASFLERDDIRDYGIGVPLVAMMNKVIEPLGNSMPDWKIWAELGKKMGYGEYFPWESDEDLLNTLLGPTNVTLDQLRRSPGGVLYRASEEKRYLKEGFKTPSGKMEIYSETMERHGYDPLPTFKEPVESPVSRPDLAEKYPLILTTGARVVAFHHSQHRNIPKLRRMMPEPLIEVNTTTAASLNIANGDMVIVESPRGSIKLKAAVTEDIHPKVVSIQHGWAEANANILIDDEMRDPVSGFPGFKALLCRVTKA